MSLLIDLLPLVLGLYAISLIGVVIISIIGKIEFSTSLLAAGIVIVITLVFGWVAVGELEGDLHNFCLSEGYFDSRGSTYCLSEDNKFLVEQKVKRVNDKWLFIKASLSRGSDE